MSHDSDPALTWLEVQLTKAEDTTDHLARVFRRKSSPEHLARLNESRRLEGLIRARRDEYARKFHITTGQ